jgi:hypothetical protein
MSRETVASAGLTADQVGLLGLHRHLPECSLVELLHHAEQVGHPVRAALFHFQQCPRCTPAALVGDGLACLRGRTLLAACRVAPSPPEPA